MSRKTSDLAIGYTMQSDFWFRVDADGNVRGKAYAVYQPTFDAAGMNNKITVAKSVVNGALSLLPGGELGVYKNAIAAGKAGTSVSLSGLVGVVGTYEDPKPVRVGAISGSLRKGTLRLAWADPEAEPAGIPATISLQYINTQQPIAHPTLKTRTPWQDAATIDPDSTGRFAIAQSQQSSTKEGVSESTFSYWNATRLQ